uniref:Uncharacterized protein n=1 Tax=Skeletonema marinoi TaxID=267567 RepID=A0A7S2KK91_9STRA|mmetsp:Transcript_1408/g.2336  ORF Transcript_1408/g.2336 Transcript_1408/m.2336 type:complete len:269 (+) Transcript_1408:144-950(+)
MTMRRYSTDSSSFSGIDWSGMFGERPRQQQQQQSHNSNADSIDIPSMDDVGVASSSGGKKKKGKQQRRLSVTFDLNDEMIDNSCHEDIMEDGHRIVAEKSATRSSKSTSTSSSRSWCLVLTVMLIVVGAVACFVVFLPKTASHNWKKAMSGMRDWKSSNNVVQQQLLQQQQGRGQEMLELAEQITLACGESSLLRSGSSVSSSGSAGGGGGGGVDARSGMSSCQELCHNHMCCVEQDDEYSCKGDVAENCGVYAGCVALIDDSFFGER